MMMKRFVAFFIALMLLGTPASANAGTPITVVEMFTAQGCAGCIPASLYLKGLREKPEMLVLSWPVNYLDRFGWTDTLASPDHSERQKAYNRRFGRGGIIYTPEMVVDGRVDQIGHDRDLAEETIAAQRAQTRFRLNPRLALTDDALVITLPKTAIDGKVAVNVAWYAADTMVDISDGENKGMIMHAVNVVRRHDLATLWRGAARTITIPLESVKGITVDHVAVLLQKGDRTGAIIGGASLALAKAGS